MKVFIVDDEKIIRKGISSILQQHIPSLEIIGEAADGAEALEKISANTPDIVITDVKMPTMDGVELTKELHRQHPSIKIIVLSGYDDYNYVRQSMKNGALDYLLKPIDKHEFLSLINLLVRNESEPKEQPKIDSNELISNAKNYIRKHYSDDITMTQVADYVHLNPSYFSKLFRTKTGLTFSVYLTDVRISQAKQLLLNPNIKIYEVCEKVGFSDSVTFNRSFKRVVGVSPSEFRNQFNL